MVSLGNKPPAKAECGSLFINGLRQASVLLSLLGNLLLRILYEDPYLQEFTEPLSRFIYPAIPTMIALNKNLTMTLLQ